MGNVQFLHQPYQLFHLSGTVAVPAVLQPETEKEGLPKREFCGGEFPDLQPRGGFSAGSTGRPGKGPAPDKLSLPAPIGGTEYR